MVYKLENISSFVLIDVMTDQTTPMLKLLLIDNHKKHNKLKKEKKNAGS